ncbi:tyrosine-protein phosphatase [Pseudoalteromonas sp. MMG013]|uniref:phosphatase domain-containing protein n=1 Tax=unclassified Pseudoalteromonas TaxID=194690 RepID=UPI001B390925|nr:MULTISPECIES: tyrosine-protein phosphatase [unclassified Pseudoalteromonas]MBQ4848232.1 tyrosine-protein phosphatase [Pseudoalteromonas sp. MMG005]MBQ4860090.1 tyrosine-protein phosphatase [Pseudoalteromonas sp. MMG013]
MRLHPYDTLSLDNGGQIIFTPCPGTKDATLQESVEILKSAGANALISVMYDKELTRYGAQTLSQVCMTQGIEWYQLPISDEAPPTDAFSTAWADYVPKIISLLNDQGVVVVHCKGGSGRTGLVVALLMHALGYDKLSAKNAVQRLRPKALCHPEQLRFFNDFMI